MDGLCVQKCSWLYPHECKDRTASVSPPCQNPSWIRLTTSWTAQTTHCSRCRPSAPSFLPLEKRLFPDHEMGPPLGCSASHPHCESCPTVRDWLSDYFHTGNLGNYINNIVLIQQRSNAGKYRARFSCSALQLLKSISFLCREKATTTGCPLPGRHWVPVLAGLGLDTISPAVKQHLTPRANISASPWLAVEEVSSACPYAAFVTPLLHTVSEETYSEWCSHRQRSPWTQIHNSHTRRNSPMCCQIKKTLLLSLWTQKPSLKLLKYFQHNRALLQMQDFFMHFFPLYWGFCFTRKKWIQQNAPHLVSSGKVKSRGFFQFMPWGIHF